MKTLSKLIDIILYFLVAVILFAAIPSVVQNQPILFSAVRSNSMYPLLERGDLAVISKLSETDQLSIGDIVIFRAEEGELAAQGYVAHRIIGGNLDEGYITKGDANDYSDQTLGSPPIERRWLVSKIVVNHDQPVTFPLIGYLTIWMERVQSNRYTLPIIASLLIGVICICEFKSNQKKKVIKKNKTDLQSLYFLSGLAISVIIATLMLTSSQKIAFRYNVSKNDSGVVMGSSVGIVNVGDQRQLALADIKNDGYMPVAVVITSNDSQLSFSHVLITLKKGHSISTQVLLKAQYIGNYNSTINIGLFYPFLPNKLIYILADISYWLALAAVSLIPGLPLMVYPIIDQTMRRQTGRRIRRSIHRIKNLLPI